MSERRPSHPELFEVEVGEGDFSSSLKAVRAFQAGERICPVGNVIFGQPNKWYTVQTGEGPDDIVELRGSDLNFVNHSCEPSIVFDVSSPWREDWHVRAVRDIARGDALTYFYPSTEWEMAQPFECNCGSTACLGRVTGAAALSSEQLHRFGFVNPHILRLAERRDSKGQ